jgi:hypothetical protein
LQAQEAANKRGPAAAAALDAADAAAAEREAAGALPHAAPANELDEALAREGVTGYKALLAAGQNASHIAGADVEGGVLEFETVADKLNFEVGGAAARRLQAPPPLHGRGVEALATSGAAPGFNGRAWGGSGGLRSTSGGGQGGCRPRPGLVPCAASPRAAQLFCPPA